MIEQTKERMFHLKNYEDRFFLNFEMETALAENGGASVLGIVCGGCFST